MRTAFATCALGLCALAATTTPALAGPAHHTAGKTMTFRYYSVVQTLVLTHKDGTTIENPSAPPAAGDRLEITENGYAGTHKSHSKKVASTSHTLCVFTKAKAAPTCDGQGAIGSEMMLFHTPSNGPTEIVGGTGRYKGATGKVTSKEIGNGNNSDIVITVTLAK